MAKLLFSLLILAVIFGIPSCKANESADLNDSISGIESPQNNAILEGGEILNGLLCSPSEPIAVDNDNILWMNIYAGLIAYYDNKFQIFDRYNTNIPCSDITQIFVDSHNKKWFGNNWGDVFTFDNQEWKILPTPEGVKNIGGIQQDTAGTIWVLSEHCNDNLGILWNYEDDKVDKVVYCNKKDSRDITGLAIDSDNNKWIAIRGTGLHKCNGDNCTNMQNIFPNTLINSIYYDKRNDILYISADNYYKYIEGKRTHYEGGIYTHKDGRFEVMATEKTGLPSPAKRIGGIKIMSSDIRGNLWLGYITGWPYYIVLGRVDNGQWISFVQESSISNLHVEAVTSDHKGSIWLLDKDPLSEQYRLATFNGETYTTISLPLLSKDPRTWWQEKELSDLFKYPVSPVNKEEFIENPLSYRGKKMSFIGKGEIGREYSGLVDKEGTKLNISPVFQDELPRILKDTGIDKAIYQSEYQEYIGYLHFVECYPRIGGQTCLFTTEVYPFTPFNQQKTGYRKLYEAYVNALAQDKKDIQLIVDQWISAKRSGNIEELKKLYPPNGRFYKYALTEKGQEDIKNNTMDVTINDSSIKVENINATVNIYDATVKPEKQCEPGMGCIGIWKFRYIKLHKYGTEWKITETFYAPDPAPTKL